jgi:CRP-like cAMP-binding protein
MSAVLSPNEANALIASLPRAERHRFPALCEIIELVPGDILCEPGQSFPRAYFPVSGVISVVTMVDGGPALELALIGHDGMLGATLSLDIPTAPARGIVQGAGSALVIGVAQLRAELRSSPQLLRIVHRYQYRLLMQMLQTATCIHFHEIEPRLARCLLMTHDLSVSNSDTVHLTHEFLARTLGVRRSGVTIAAGTLQQHGLISYTRGEIRILDRAGLEAAACGCYAALIDKQKSMFG